MQHICRMIAGCLVLLLVALSPVRGADKFKNLAVMPFENLSSDKTLNPLGAGIAETLINGLASIRDLSVVERGRLNDVLKEIKFSGSGAVDVATAQRAGRLLGADTIVVGSFQKNQNSVRITARAIEVENGTVRANALVDGSFNDIFKLQDAIAEKLTESIRGTITAAERSRLAERPGRNIEAGKAFSEGLALLRKDAFNDAIEQFDRALSLDNTYLEAGFYRGMAQAKLQRWDDAVASFKRILPQTQRQNLEKWSWNVPQPAGGRTPSLVRIVHTEALGAQDLFSREGIVRHQGNPLYIDGKTLHIVDLERRTTLQTELPEAVALNTGLPGSSSDEVYLVLSASLTSLITGRYSMYGIGAKDGKILWRSDVAVPPAQIPLAGISKGILWEYLTPDRLAGFNARTNEKLWERSGLDLEFVGPKIKSTRAFGDLLIVKSPKTRQISGIALADGKTAWTVNLQSERSYHLVSNDIMIVFEPDTHVFAVDLETGKNILDLAIKQNARSQPRGLVTVNSLVAGSTLYFQSVEGELLAINLAAGAAQRTLWKTPINSRIKSFQEGNSRVFAATESGELIALDAKSGRVLGSTRATEKDLDIDFLNGSMAVVSSVEALFGYDPTTLEKKWQFPLNGPTKKPVYFKNAVLVQSSVQLSALDVETGTLLWQYGASQLASEPALLQTVNAGLSSVFVSKDSLFLLSHSGVKEYSVERAPGQGITEKEVLAELASALLAKGALDEATSYANRIAQEIDANYAPLRYLQARLDQARGNTAAAQEKLAAYVTLVGRQSRAGQDVLLELRRDAGLRWDSEVGAGLSNSQPLLLDNKLVNISRSSGSDSQIVAIDPNSGRVLWRQSGERFLDMTYDVRSRRLYYARGLNREPTVVLLYSVDLSNGDRKEVARISGGSVIGRVALGFANGRLFLGSVSSDISTQSASIRMQAFDAGSGKKLWEKTHESQGNMLDFLLSPLGLFEPHGDYFAYSVGRDVWVLRGEDGTIDGHLLEAAPLLEQWRRIDTAYQDADLIYFNSAAGVGSVQVVAFYSISGKKVLRRTARFLLKMDSGVVACVAGNECGFRGDSLLVNEGTAVTLLDASSDSLPIPVKWRVPAATGRFLAAFAEGDIVWVTRSDAVALKLDRASGRILDEYSYSRLWRSSALMIESGRGYVYTPDGLAFSFELKARK